MAAVRRLQVWLDPVARSGPEAMAMDEWLLETAVLPVLRVYRWLGEWGSVGYFGVMSEARAAFPGVSWVRRWTGGGTVDHRTDWTYTVITPAGEELTTLRGAESYRVVHAALAAALGTEGHVARLSTGAAASGEAVCFENPVSHDLIGGGGRKLAGAGQRRSRDGLLHQGSVALNGDAVASGRRAEALAGCLAQSWELVDFQAPPEIIAAKIARRYGRKDWTERR